MNETIRMKQSHLKVIVLVVVALVLEAPSVFGEERPPKGEANSLPASQPYSAEEKTERVRTLPDGTRASPIVSTARVYRDGKGSTRREVSITDPSGSHKNTTAITISDAVAGERYELDPTTRIAYREALTNSGTKRGGTGGHREGELREGGRDGEGEHHESGRGGEGEHHEGNRGGEGVGGEKGGKNRAKRQHEDLGFKMIEGLNAHGSRNSYRQESSTDGKALVSSDEQWVAVDLGVVVKSIHSDPRTGDTLFTLTNVTRGEPEPSLFQVPKGYTIKQLAHDK